MSANAEIKQFIDRIIRLKEEQDTLGEDIREVYAEAKGRGYDKTAMGGVVAHVRKVEKLGRDALHEREAIFDLYLTAYQGSSHTPAPAHTRENIEEFPPETASECAAPEKDAAADEQHVEATVEQRSSASNFEPPAFLQSQPLKTARDYRPHCQKPDACGASGLKHCYTCSKLIPAESEAA